MRCPALWRAIWPLTQDCSGPSRRSCYAGKGRGHRPTSPWQPDCARLHKRHAGHASIVGDAAPGVALRRQNFPHYSDPHPRGDAASPMNGDGMQVRHAFIALLPRAALAGTALAAAAVLAPAGSAGAASSPGSAPGVTANSITVGSISTQTGTLAANFSSLIYGERAYYDYINAQGGVNGRK